MKYKCDHQTVYRSVIILYILFLLWNCLGVSLKTFECLFIKFKKYISNHLVLPPCLFRIMMQTESNTTPPTDQGIQVDDQEVIFTTVLPSPTETQIHSVLKLISLQPSTATCLAPNSFLRSFESSFSFSLKSFQDTVIRSPDLCLPSRASHTSHREP